MGMSQADHAAIAALGINELPQASAVGGLGGYVDAVTFVAPGNQRRQVLVWHARSLAKVSFNDGLRHPLCAEDTQGDRGSPLGILRLVDVAAAFLAQETLDLESTADQGASGDLVVSSGVC
jgi:hypothetical protein